LDAVVVLDRLGCYWKADPTFAPIESKHTKRLHLNVEGVDFELLITGPKFFDPRAKRGGGGAVDLVMHLYGGDFRGAVRRLRAVL
jgi:hypothetical protein